MKERKNAMAEESKTVVAEKRGAQKQYIIYGCIIALLAAFAGASAGFNAEQGAGFIAVGIILAILALCFAVYCFVLYAMQKKLPDALIYAEGDTLYCYQYKKKEYIAVRCADILSADGGITPRDMRAGLVRIKTAERTVEVVEIAEPFAAREKILRLKLSAEGVRGEENV